MHGADTMEGLENNAVAASNLPVEAFIRLALQWFHEAAERVIGKFPNVVQDTVPAVGRDRLKLSCGVAVNVYEPGHTRAAQA